MSFPVSLVGLDSAGGGLLLPAGQLTFVRVNGLVVAHAPVTVAAHGGAPHTAAQVLVGSAFVRIAGRPVVFAGLPATCGDLVTGSAHVTVAV